MYNLEVFWFAGSPVGSGTDMIDVDLILEQNSLSDLLATDPTSVMLLNPHALAEGHYISASPTLPLLRHYNVLVHRILRDPHGPPCPQKDVNPHHQ